MRAVVLFALLMATTVMMMAAPVAVRAESDTDADEVDVDTAEEAFEALETAHADEVELDDALDAADELALDESAEVEADVATQVLADDEMVATEEEALAAEADEESEALAALAGDGPVGPPQRGTILQATKPPTTTTPAVKPPTTTTAAAKPATTTAAKPATTTPAKPATTTPAKPATTTPAKPATTTPAKPAATTTPATKPPVKKSSIDDLPAALHRLAPWTEAPLAQVLNQPKAWYGHGGYMGFAGALVGDQKWMNILKALMPDVAQEILTKSDIVGIVKGMENNPVCAAYGYSWYRTNRHPQASQPFEWDSFFAPAATAANPMVEATLVAHGKPLELFKEGTWKKNAYGAVERTAQTEFGGVTAAKWRDIFTNAMRLAADPTADPKAPVTWSQFNALFPGGHFQVILDVKTGAHQADNSFLLAVVRAWQSRGVLVRGVGTFNVNQHSGIAKATGGQTAEVLFFHGLEDRGVPLIAQPQLFDVYAKFPGRLQGKTVLFNGGFLIRYQRTGINYLGLGKNTKQSSYAIDTDAVEKLRAITKAIPTMSLGIYVQEYDIDTVALSLLNRLVSTEPTIFKSGFAWGGKSSVYYDAIKPTVSDGTVGTNGQILFAKVKYA